MKIKELLAVLLSVLIIALLVVGIVLITKNNEVVKEHNQILKTPKIKTCIATDITFKNKKTMEPKYFIKYWNDYWNKPTQHKYRFNDYSDDFANVCYKWKEELEGNK